MTVPYASALAYANLLQQKHIQQEGDINAPSKRVSMLKKLAQNFMDEASKDQMIFQVGEHITYADTHVAFIMTLLKKRMDQIRYTLANDVIPQEVLEAYFREEPR